MEQRLELIILFIAEFIAVSYYRACQEGAGDRLAGEVAGRIQPAALTTNPCSGHDAPGGLGMVSLRGAG